MSYQVLARKWRPRNFTELMGQEHVVRALTGGLSQGRLHHAFLFTGTRGVGKTTIARIIAKALNCETGVTATPCGVCSNCRDIDAGRFPDLIEIDAASRTKVDDTREILDNVIYAPSRGRFKVYLIDEVHMLSTHSFNALLKTLEEPPEHVKFLLATTDPQKLPVTVLSRCLKFHLKRLTIAQITQQMHHILAAEAIAFENEAIDELARGADGSMRDGLSLLDQALAFGGGKVETIPTREMLGTISREGVLDLLEALSVNSAEQLSEKLSDLADFGGSYVQVLARLMEHLHQLAFLQLVGPHSKLLNDVPPRLAALATRFSAEDLQIKFQFANLGAKEVASAPDAKIAFEMCLLRMLAFADMDAGIPESKIEKPVASGVVAVPPGKTNGDGAMRAVADSANTLELTKTGGSDAGNLVQPVIRNDESPASPENLVNPEAASQPNCKVVTPAHASFGAGIESKFANGDVLADELPAQLPELLELPKVASEPEPKVLTLAERWQRLVATLPLPSGALREFAHNALARSWQNGALTLTVDAAHSSLASAENVHLLAQYIEQSLGQALSLQIVIADADLSASPAHVNAREFASRAQAFEDSITDRSLVRDLIQQFSASVVPGSIYFSGSRAV